MNIERLKELLRMSDNPDYAMRMADQQVVPNPQATATPPVQPNPKAVNQDAIKKVANTMISGGGANPNAAPSANPAVEGGAGISLSDNLRRRRQERSVSQSMPGRISMGGY